MRILLTGARGFVGGHLWPQLASAHELWAVVRQPLSAPAAPVVELRGDLEDGHLFERLKRIELEVVVHLAAFTDAEGCERDPEAARRVNAEIPARLASALDATCRRFILVSTDLVFDGERGSYAESDVPRPISVYGATKLEGEKRVGAVLGPRVCSVRLALTYGPRSEPASRPSFAERMIRAAAGGSRVPLFTDEFRSPIYVEDAAESLSRLVEIESPPALLHLGGPERLSRYRMGEIALRRFGLSAELGEKRRRADAPGTAPRPEDCSLDSSLARSLGFRARDVEEGLRSMKRGMEGQGFMVGL